MIPEKKQKINQIIVNAFGLILLIWTCILGFSLWFNIHDQQNKTVEVVKKIARANFNKDQAYRIWASSHGGVYVTPTQKTPPSPWMSHVKDRDIVTTTGKKLTLMNPAYMIREMMSDYSELYGIKGRIFGIKYLNPNNKATPQEAKIIKRFDKGEKEVSEIQGEEKSEEFFLARPMIMKQACQKCHGHLGFKNGSVRGSVSISVSMLPYRDIEFKLLESITITHILVWLIGCISLIFFSKKARKSLEEKEKYIDEIKISSLVFEDTIDAILITNDKGDILRTNDAFTKLTGYSFDEVVGKNPNILKSGFHDAKFYEKLWNDTLTQGSWKGEIQNKKKNEELFISYQSISTVKDENGNIKYMTSILRDITEQKNYEKQIEDFNKDLQKKIEKRTNDLTQKTNKITDLLNNASQGFLSFGKDFLIDDEYSIECEKLLEKDLKNKDINELLFDKKRDKIEFFKETMIDALNEKNELTSSLILSLLPNELIINKRAIAIEYKILSSNKFMMILTNITDKKKLQTKIKREQNILKMIVSIVSDSIQFYETKENFEIFCKDSILYVNLKHTVKENANTLHALLHTFKGLFAQLYMKNSVQKLHEFESKLLPYIKNEKDNNALKNLIESFHLITSMDDDLQIIQQMLGNKFLLEHNHINIDEELLNKLEYKISEFCSVNNDQKQECEAILYDIKKIKNKSLKSYLSIYPKLCQQLCLSLNKSIYSFEIKGPDNTFIPDTFKSFVNSLVHVFRNGCDHGIETKENRLIVNKNEIGTINCKYKTLNNSLIIEISDDGKGIDIPFLKEKIKEKKLIPEEELNLSNKDEILKFIFNSNFTTNENLTQISGRGIGLASVRNELEKLNGDVKIETEVNKGTTFIFRIPLINN